MVHVARNVDERRIGVRLAGTVVGRVPPRGGAHAKAVALLVDEVELAEEVEAVRHEVAAVEAVGAFVRDRRIADQVIAAFDPYPAGKAHGVVPADRNVRVSRIELECQRAPAGERRGQRRDRRAHALPLCCPAPVAAHSPILLVSNRWSAGVLRRVSGAQFSGRRGRNPPRCQGGCRVAPRPTRRARPPRRGGVVIGTIDLTCPNQAARLRTHASQRESTP